MGTSAAAERLMTGQITKRKRMPEESVSERSWQGLCHLPSDSESWGRGDGRGVLTLTISCRGLREGHELFPSWAQRSRWKEQEEAS